MPHAKNLSLSAVLALLCCVWLWACSTPSPVDSSLPETHDPAQKTLFAVYMVGSDLEDDIKPRNLVPDEVETGKSVTTGSGSDDLREMLTAWKKMSAGNKSHLEVWVAYGGARKAGWKGVKYADLDCLAQDAGDDYFGNADCYAYQNPEVNMATADSLAHFIGFLKQQAAADGRKMLHFWNHGLAYLGVGYNTTATEKRDYITLPELRSAFKTGRVHFDLISFDACLMGSLEVAQVVQPYADYMLASEELEPGHGWNYTATLDLMAAGALRPLPDLGQGLVNSYMDNPAHQMAKSQFKTYSLLDLQQLEPTVQSLNALVAQLKSSEFNNLLQAVTESQRFGEEIRNDLYYSLDLIDWLKRLKTESPVHAPLADQVLQNVQKLVLYARHDSTKPQANGISIYSLNARLKKNYGAEQSFSRPWLDFADTFVATGSEDIIPPALTSGTFATQQQKPGNLCTEQDRAGHCFEISDNLGLKAVRQVYALQADPRYYFKIGAEPLQSLSGKAYFAPVWNGEWYLLCDGSCQTGKSLFPPAYYSGQTETNGRIYTSEARLNGLDVVFYLVVGQNNSVVDAWAVPYEVGDQGEVILSRDQRKLQAGDTLQFYYQVYDLEKNLQLWKTGQTLTFSQNPRWSYARIEAPRVYFVQAEDYKGNLAVSDLYQTGLN